MENTIILNSGEKIEVLFQDEVSLDIDCALRYIKSGEAEIEAYVRQTAKPKLDEVIKTADKQFDAKISQGIQDASSAASAAGAEAVAASSAALKQEVADYAAETIFPQVEAKTAAAQAAVASAESSASQAQTAANTAAASASAAATSETNAAASAEAAATAAANADTANCVHKTGSESISGTKTFSTSPLVPTASASDNSRKAASTAFVRRAVQASVLPGTVIAWPNIDEIPSGYLFCDGAEVSRETYTDLFDVIGVAYGVGDGETTFNLPNATRVLTGALWAYVSGTGKAIGLTDGTKKYAMRAGTVSSSGVLTGTTTNFGSVVGTSETSNDLSGGNNKLVGFSQTGAETGLKVNFPYSAQLGYCIKY